jgi:hypothetical protein
LLNENTNLKIQNLHDFSLAFIITIVFALLDPDVAQDVPP